MRKKGFIVEQQKAIQVYYDGVVVGDYIADLIVDDSILIELKAVKDLDDIYIAQCLNYLKATKLKVCLLLNFGTPRLGIKRIINTP